MSDPTLPPASRGPLGDPARNPDPPSTRDMDEQFGSAGWDVNDSHDTGVVADDIPPGGGSPSGEVAGEGRRVAQEAAESGKQVGWVAADEAASVARDARSQARSLVDEAASQLSSQAADQKDTLVSWLRSLADELRSMAEGSRPQGGTDDETDQTQPGYARDLADRGADYAQRTASWLGDHDPAEVLQEVGHFARRRPGAFLVLAAAAGVVVGRLTRGLAASASDDSGPSSPARGPLTDGSGRSSDASSSAARGSVDPGLAGEVRVPVGGTRPGMESQQHEIGSTPEWSVTSGPVDGGGYGEDRR